MKRFIKKILVFTIIPVLGIILIELGCFIIKVPKISYHDYYSKSQNLMPLIDSNTVLFLGDSRIEWGIKPEIIKSQLGINIIIMAMPYSNGIDILNYLKTSKIFPKMIILGYTPNYGRYINHNLDKTIYSYSNKLFESLKYNLKQNSYVVDYQSLVLLIEGVQPFIKRHVYDEMGGVSVTEYGNYKRKSEYQYEMYTNWFDSFDSTKLENYHLSIKEYKNCFEKGNTLVYGLYMPISCDFFNLEKINYDREYVFELFENKFFDYSQLTYHDDLNSIDSLYFLDGSHLSPEYSVTFSKQFAVELETQMNKNFVDKK